MAKKANKPTVRTTRRRETTSDGSRRRADAPQRRRENTPNRPPPLQGSGSGGSNRPPSYPTSQQPTTSFGGPGGGGLKLPPIVMVIIVVIFLCIAGATTLLGGGSLFSGDGNEPSQLPQNPQNPPASDGSGGFSSSQENSAPVINPPGGDGQTWTVMMYQDADDKILEEDIFLDLNEAERIGSTDRVQIVAQIDRYRSGYSGDGNWSSARRYYVTRDDDLNAIGSEVVEDGGEVNMADTNTLVDFVVWAANNYPADNYVLIMSDHGLGWPGGWSDTDSKVAGSGGTNVPLANSLGDQIYLMELDEALGTIREQTGIESFELIGMDACLMGHIEVFSALAPHANYAVASQETEPALGWAYAGFLQQLVNNPDMDGAGLGQAIVDSYIQEDQRILDDQARADLLRQSGGGGLSGLFGVLGGGGGQQVSASQLVQQMGKNSTISAVNLNALNTLNSSLNNLALALQEDNQRTIAQVRTYTQSYTNIFGQGVPDPYLDLGHFAALLIQQSGNSAVSAAANEVLSAIDQAVVAEKHGPDKPAASGVSIYFPNSQIYGVPAGGPQSYNAIAKRFTDTSLWDDFLAFHYTGQSFTADSAPTIPDTLDVRGPGSEAIQLSPITASSDVAAPGQPVLLSTDVTGENVAYAYFFAGFFDTAANSIYVADSDYLESGDTRELNGVYYPVWPDTDSFTLEFEWDPIVFAITDGTQSVVAHFNPETYGETSDEAVYTVDGTYTYADTGESYFAKLYFQDGVLRSVFGFTNPDGTGAPREIIPNVGDTFTIQEEWLDLTGSSSQPTRVTQTGETLTFTNQTFTWEDLIAAEGQYVVGFIVEDLDGNKYQVFTEIEVQ